MTPPRLKKLEHLLGVSVQKIVPMQKYWCIETITGRWVAKKGVDSSHLQWWRHIDHELRSRGFHSMPRSITDGSKWLFSSLIEGTSCCYSDWNQVQKVIHVLARFHAAGIAMKTPPNNGSAFLLYDKLYRRLNQFWRVLHVPVTGEMGQFLRSYGDMYYQYGLQAWYRLSRLPFQIMNIQEYHSRNLTHRDLASHNWIIDDKGNPWLIDFDTAHYDIQLGDLWQIMTRVLCENDWDEELLYEILRQYETIHPLSDLRKKILWLLLLYPNEFYRETIGILKQRPGYDRITSFPYLQKIVKQRDKWLSCLNNSSL